tara:strand:- start:4697 stop:5341 length:645 start_codon:yes stop_codon:yes gene_type:complete
MKLITEINEDLEYIVEDINGKKHLFINGVFMMSETKNRNGRIYPKDILFNEVNRYRENYVDKKRAFGELGHPEGPTINLERVSHMVTELKEDDKNIIGKAKIMDTPYGNIVKNLINEGAKLGVSSRGMGSLEEKGGANYVKNDFYLATAADIVADPSAPDAFVDGIMEGKEWIWDNGIVKESTISKLKESVRKSPASDLESIKLKAFNSFLSKI